MRYLISLLFFTILLLAPSCNSQYQAAQERRNLMMPQKHELPRNTKHFSANKTKKMKYR